MPEVYNLSIKRQSGDGGSHYATWEFNEMTDITVTTGTGITIGSLVTIKSGATYYNGTHIPNWVMADQWYVSSMSGDRVVLGRNPSGTHNIRSPINIAYLNGGSTTTTTQSLNTLDHYAVYWYYDTGDGIWFKGSSGDTNDKISMYSAPSNAIRIKCTVLPIAKTRQVNGTDMAYWVSGGTTIEYSIDADPPENIATPSVEIDKYKLTATIENISDPRTDEVKFEIYNGVQLVNTGVVTVLTCRATYTCNVAAGGEYRVRAAAININSGYGISKNGIDNRTRIYGKWSDFSSVIKSIPATPAGITVCKASSKTSVHLEWSPVASATSYDIEYTTKKEYFDGSDQTTTVTGIEFTHYEKTGLETGNQYFFRIRAVNEKGESGWSGISAVILGKDPAAPTTWSSTTTAITGEPLTLYWVHNSEDGSSQTYAQLEITINGKKSSYTIKNTNDEDTKDKTSSYPIDTSKYTEGTTIKWRVRTAGVTNTYGKWSIVRTIDIYAPATLSLAMNDSDGAAIDVLTGFPFYVTALAGPKTQSPLSYHLTILSNQVYQTIDQVGTVKMVNQGEEVYSKYFDTTESLVAEISASSVDLKNGMSYIMKCVVAMNSGLTAEASLTFSVSWMETTYEPNAEIGIDQATYSAYIRPYCLGSDGLLASGVKLAVYRREFDGSFVEIGSEIENGRNVHVTDPHPALDYARYRIVATEEATGAVSYYDPPGYPVLGSEIVVQWDEEWSVFDTSNSDEMEEPAWAGSLLTLPYNIDISDSNSPDVELIEYEGRSNPVSYYGTQKGFTSTWNVDVVKTDKDTLYGLRRLQQWMGDVYVREPSGSGYWANIKVSFSRKHGALVMPVTLNVTRVEGAM